MSVISRVGVVMSAVEDAVSNTINLTLDVHFHFGEKVRHPLNLGSMPPLSLGVDAVAGLVSHETAVLQLGRAPANFSFPEQRIEVNATADVIAALEGGLSFHFNGEQTSTTIPLNGTATQLRDCLSTMRTIGEIEVFIEPTAAGFVWLVRFYAEGDPAHIGPQPSIIVNTSQLVSRGGSSSGRRLSAALSTGLTVSTVITSEGTTPFSAADTDDSSITVVNDYEGVNSSSVDAIVYQPPLHICGNGIRSTAENCDDNNTVGGDGCDALCRLEVGWQCTSSNTEGSGIGGVDTCAPLCGDGIRILWNSAEQCDDNNTDAGDGCSPTCQIEAGFICSGGSINTPDACTAVCGDGRRVGSEICDDGSTVSLDGCRGDCGAIEDGFTCAGGSSTSADTCVSCDATCAVCSGPSATDCTSCAAATPFFNLLGSGRTGACMSSCAPVGKYANASGMCESCDPSCGTCSGPASTECISCSGTNAPFLTSGQCVAACPSSGTFVELIGTQATCSSCHSSCETCSAAHSSACLTCPSSGTPLLDDSSCVASCPSGKYADANTSSCVACNTSGC